MSKDKQLKVRLSESQHTEIKSNAQNLGVSVSTFVLNRCLGLKFKHEDLPKVIVKKETVIKYSNVTQADPELIRQVALIGNNINQIARALNRSESFKATELLLELQSISESLRGLVDVE